MTLKQSVIVISAICILFTKCSTLKLNKTEECRVQLTDMKGICRLVDNCLEFKDLVNKQAEQCGFEAQDGNICCSSENEILIDSTVDVPLTERVFFQKCIEYQDKYSSSPSLFNITGGNAEPKELPHMALIGDVDPGDENPDNPKDFQWFCSGTLISENFVLTGAKCIVATTYEAKYVRLGDLDYGTEEDDAQFKQFQIIETFVHPLRSLSSKFSSYHDIALVRIDGIVEFNEYIRPACLSDVDTILSEKLVATGWGATSYKSDIHKHLQKVQLNMFSHTECNEICGRSRKYQWGIVNKTQLCAGSREGERDTCVGFGGGPLLNTNHTFSCLYEIIGITSFSLPCGEGAPGIYTRLSPYKNWIERIVWPENTERNRNQLSQL